MKREKHRIKELTKLLTRSQEQTEHMARLTLQRRKIVKALKQHRKTVSTRRKQLTEQQKLIEARLRGHDRALVVGNQHGYNCDYGVIITDRMNKTASRSEGIFGQIPANIYPKIKTPPQARVTSTATSWNRSTEVSLSRFSGEPQLTFKTPFPAPQDPDSDAVIEKYKEFLNKHGIDDYLTCTSKIIATSAVLDMYFALRNDLMLLYSYESLMPQSRTKCNQAKAELKQLKAQLAQLEKAAAMEQNSSKQEEAKKETKSENVPRPVVG